MGFEKLSAFYLGKHHDSATATLGEQYSLYECKHLTTHEALQTKPHQALEEVGTVNARKELARLEIKAKASDITPDLLALLCYSKDGKSQLKPAW
jgi:hypothetical protein